MKEIELKINKGNKDVFILSLNLYLHSVPWLLAGFYSVLRRWTSAFVVVSRICSHP